MKTLQESLQQIANIKTELTFSELIGRLRLKIEPVMSTSGSEYMDEKLHLQHIAQLVHKSDLVSIDMKVKKFGGSMSMVEECTIKLTPETKMDKINNNLPEDNEYSVVRKGQALNPKILNHSERQFLSQFQVQVVVGDIDNTILELYSKLRFHGAKRGLGRWNIFDFKNRIETEKEMTKSISNSMLTIFRKLDTRGRAYPTLRYGNIIPYGDHFQCRLFQAPTSEPLNESGIDLLKHLVWTIEHGRMPMEQSLQQWDDGVINDIAKSNFDLISKQHALVSSLGIFDAPTGIIEAKDLGDILHFNKMVQLINHGIGHSTPFFSEMDKTNSGLIVLANALRDTKLLRIANLLDMDKVYDSHQMMADAINKRFKNQFTRNQVKKIQVGLLHGASIASMVKSIGENESQIPLLAEALTEVYGEHWSLPNRIASVFRGIHLSGLGVPTVSFKLRDGFVAESTSYLSGAKVSIGGRNVVCDMPMVASLGKPLKAITGRTSLDGKYVEVGKAMGGYAKLLACV